jgi:hypothetical protein
MSTVSGSESTVNLGPGLVTGLWIQAAIAIIVVALRIIAKLRIHKFEIDDVVMIFALVRIAHIFGFPSTTAIVKFRLIVATLSFQQLLVQRW